MWSAESRGWLYGWSGMLGFSLTLPATRVAVTYLDPNLVALGRALVAAVLAALVLCWYRAPWPDRRQWQGFLVVALGVVLGFPLLSAWAMRDLEAAHGAVVMGVLPLATALAAALRAGERPSLGFWITGVVGSALVISFAVHQGAGSLHIADLALLAAVAAAASGYSEGGRLARQMGGWQVICWALLLVAPIALVPVAVSIRTHGVEAPIEAWLGFAYVSLISQFLGFFAWYQGLALAGVARVGQLQLLMPFFTLLASALLLDETITPTTLGFALAVLISVIIGRRMPVTRVAPSVIQN